MEDNRKGPGVFYAVVGVATLVVAIIGATFAYFSASADVTGDQITGGTQDISGALTAEVDVIYDGSNADAGAGLVPSDITNSATAINAAVGAQCVSKGYAGCHLYQIHVKSTTTLDAVELNLASMEFTGTAPKDTKSWKWVIYQAADGATSSSTTYTMAGNSIVDSGDNFATTNASIRKAGMTANTDYYYYLMVYIVNDTDAAQNASDTKNVLGTYKGTISLAGGTGGKVSATFLG